MASIVAHRTSFDPCLVTLPRYALRSDSLCFGVSPAHELHRRSRLRHTQTVENTPTAGQDDVGIAKTAVTRSSPLI